MDSSGYSTRFHPPKEKNVGGSPDVIGLYFIFFLLEHPLKVIPVLCFPPALILHYLLGLSIGQTLATACGIAIAAVVGFGLSLVILSHLTDDGPDLQGDADWAKYVEIKDEKIANSYKGKKIPMANFVQLYLTGKANWKEADPAKTLFEQMFKIFRFNLTLAHLSFFTFKFVGQLTHHSQNADAAEIKPVYNRGNDFYRWFLGPRMVYTSGIFESDKDTLEEAQDRKLDIVCRKLRLQPGDELLDIGCGWGTLICHAAKYYGVKATGVTLAQEQREWLLNNNLKEYGVTTKQADILVMDYRDIPKKKYNKVSCLEMAEHVGIKHFQEFMLQVKDELLTDDGIFYLQIAGLRRAWQFADLVWGLFMGTYIFPGADASCPLAFVVGHAERAGFEIHSVETCGVHYSLTINHWLRNWMSNKDAVVAKYGEWWYRLWVMFLAWSTVIASQGSSTVYLVTMHKNTSKYDRKGHSVGKYPIAVQQ
jgi:cyclopropane fatty-acyl-phospholipid synthase-like methyltransferase